MNGTSVLHAKRRMLVCAFLAVSENYRSLMVSFRGTEMLLYYVCAQHAHNESQHTLSLDSICNFHKAFVHIAMTEHCLTAPSCISMVESCAILANSFRPSLQVWYS